MRAELSRSELETPARVERPGATTSRGRDTRRNVYGQFRDKLRDLPTLYVVLSLIVGTFLVFAQPPGQGLDEVRHFYRVWSFASGSFLPPHSQATTTIPSCVADYMNRFANEAAKAGPFSFGQYWHTPQMCSASPTLGSYGTSAFNGPISYLPAILTTALLRGVGAPVPLIFFVGRLATLIGFVAVYYVAMRVIPTGKQVLFALGLFPTTLLLASTISADPMTIGLSILAIGIALRARRSEKPDRRTFVGLFLVLAALSLTKPTLFVFAPLLFLVPSPGVGSTRRHPLVVQTVAASIVVVLAALWSRATSSVKIFDVYGLDPHKQLRFIFTDPFGYLWVLLRTFFESMGEIRWLPQFFFSIGFPRSAVPDSLYAPFGLVIVGSLTLWYAYQLQFGERRQLTGATRDHVLAWVPIVLAVAGVLLVETTLFVYGTPVGLPVTEAQGRYFYPFVPLPLMTIDYYWMQRRQSRSVRWIIFGTMIMLIWLIVKIFVHDYNL
jgi:uncharacterized membrane protein